jgi:folylpolyglutamate synthase/dihydropteroate synthase
MRDKKLDQIAEILSPLADDLILTTVNNPRSAQLDTLKPLAERFSTAASSNPTPAQKRSSSPSRKRQTTV